MLKTDFDIIVVGGGPGGYVAAIRAAQLGLRAALVEKEHLGGVCLNWGCIPTKALLRSAEVLRLARDAESYGLDVGAPSFNLAKIVSRSRAVSAQLQAGVKHLLKKNKVTVFDGHGRLEGAGVLSVSGPDGQVRTRLTAPHIILATGARARALPGLEPDGQTIWTAREAMVPTALPKRLLVIGSGAIGIEFASFYNTLGADVTVVELLDRILPVEDEDISALARKAFEKQGMTILTSSSIKKLERTGDTVHVAIDTGSDVREMVVDRVILAVGIVGNVEDIGLETTGVKVEKTHILVDPWLETDEPGIYAIGDLAGPPWLAHKASHEAVLCVERIAGLSDIHPLDPTTIPGCTFCHPQLASVGLSEAKARQLGREVRVGRFPFIGNGKAIALGETEGLVKTVFDAVTGELLGAHIIGPEATEMIQGYMLAKTLETTEAELSSAVFPHPSLSEAMHESVLDAYGRAIHF